MSVPPPLRSLRVNAVELLRSPGASRDVSVVLGPVEQAALELDDPRIAGDIVVDVVATSTLDGVTVQGEVRVPWAGECRRCLAAVSGVAVGEVDELYVMGDSLHDDALPLETDQIDLASLVREYALLELPEAPLCRPDCAGICPVCGIDRNTGTCSCDTSVRDERWAALDDLDLGD
jgi:uncharacterized protein